jgi:5'-deoxynucleotidase YfbR-like HD superfamily hydrolase
MTVKVFISHSSKDKPSVRKLVAALRNKKIQVWIDEAEIEVGDSIIKGLQKGLNESNYVCIWLTNDSIVSGWVQKEWESKISEEIRDQRKIILPLLAEDCEIPFFLRDKRCADFRTSFTHGFNELLQALGKKENPSNQKTTNYTKELLRDLERVAIPIPHYQNIFLIQGLKRIPRSGKQIRLHTYSPIVPIRSIYDHILSVAHSADCLIPQLEPDFNNSEFQTLSRCIVYHDLCEVLLGDIPSFTNLSRVTRNRVYLKAGDLLKRIPPDERDRIANSFIKMFLEEQELASINEYESVMKNSESKLRKLFLFLDKIDPLIAIWRYLYQYKNQLGDGESFTSRLKDFFSYERPKQVAYEYTNDRRVLEMIDNLGDRSKALDYYNGSSLSEIFSTLFDFHSDMLIHLIEGRKIIFTEKPQSRKVKTIENS